MVSLPLLAVIAVGATLLVAGYVLGTVHTLILWNKSIRKEP